MNDPVLSADSEYESELRAALEQAWWRLEFQSGHIEAKFIARLRDIQEKHFVLNAWLALFCTTYLRFLTGIYCRMCCPCPGLCGA